MNIADAIRIVITCAKIYEEELCGKHVLFIYQSKAKLDYIETRFMKQNFLHLTGVKYSNNSKNFFRECRESKLVANSIALDSNGTTELKLRILPQIVRINRSARMIGDYNNSKALLVTEKLVGGVCGCIGFVRDGHIFVPNTALNEDIRDISRNNCSRILAVFTKPSESTIYRTPTYVAKGVDISDVLYYRNVMHLFEISGDNKLL